ncbi:MAG TPA: hypothetical protein PKD33_04715, partial [Rhodocyclaceae bacterium]|nr:hypothetical protein [Rhodocyclaceae bacterium]HNA66209.1 hypothetical protein [Rhodocyclaceae bacterium]
MSGSAATATKDYSSEILRYFTFRFDQADAADPRRPRTGRLRSLRPVRVASGRGFLGGALFLLQGPHLGI